MGEREPSDSGAVKQVREMMIPLDDYPWVRIDDTLKYAVRVMEEARLEVGGQRSLPRVLLVFDREDELVGVVRRRDIMRGLEPNFLVEQPLETRVKLFEVGVDPHLLEFSDDFDIERVLKGLREQGRRPVGEVLRPIAASLGPEDRMMKALYEMVSLNASLLPVVENEQVIGVIRSVDIFHELALILR